MICVLIKDDDVFYRHGFEMFLGSLLSEKYSETVLFLYAFNTKNIICADIIILDLCAGEVFSCFPELKMRHQALLIGLMEQKIETPAMLPKCLSNIVIIARNEPLSSSYDKILSVVKRKLTTCEPLFSADCTTCKCKHLSQQQIYIMQSLYNGTPPSQMARR